ncbi:MAG: D-glycero-beta-D-manno-heptose-7-phosphate kinase [Deltaproteobacteria bacterium]|nr:D-glycero-beta-D-manno-heptose-7-phosphate kinase [Deltaproteobacteria bacterium]
MERFGRARLLVIGDLIMDHFIWGRVTRISPEAPVPVVDVTSESILMGGSANVVNNIHSLGGRCLVAGVVGKDADGRKLLSMLSNMGAQTEGIIIDSKRPTTIKTRIIAHSQQMVRFDRENRDKVDSTVTDKLMRYIEKAAKHVDIIVISDYAKGVITEGLMEEVAGAAKSANKPVAVDPKVAHLDYYKGLTIITPNNLEASMASNMDITDDASLHNAGEALFNRLDCEALLITRGEHGMSLFEAGCETHIPTVAQEVYDVSGAGDTVIAVLSLALAGGADFKEAAVLANYAAGIVVGKVGTAAVAMEELEDAVEAGLKKS